MFYTYTYINLDFPLDKILLLSDGNNLTGLYFADKNHAPEIQQNWICDKNLEVFEATITQLQEYAQGKRREFKITSVFSCGTVFQKKVWQEIAKIPYGKTCSYSELANAIGSPKSVRAVASAVAKNPISIIIPCHRIIGKNGKLTGYAGGLERKQTLLTKESLLFHKSL